MVFAWLFRRTRQRPDTKRRHILFYTRGGCHLCEEAWQQLEAARKQYGFSLRSIDVDSDPALVAQFGEQVPVVLVDGKVRFRGNVNAVLLRRLLDNA